MLKKLLLLCFISFYVFNSSAQSNQENKLFLAEYKYQLSRLEYIAVSKVYLQSNPFNEEDHSQVKLYLSDNSHKLLKIISQTFVDYQFDSLRKTNNGISVSELVHLKDQNILTSVNNFPQLINVTIQKTNQLFDSLQTFEDYEDPIKKFLASEELDRYIIPNIDSIFSKVKKTESFDISQNKVKRSARLLLSNLDIEASPLLKENKDIIKEIEVVLNKWKKAQNNKDIAFNFKDFQALEDEIFSHLIDIESHLFYNEYLNGMKKISKTYFREILNKDSSNPISELEFKITRSWVNIKYSILEIIEYDVNSEKGDNDIDSIEAFMINESRAEIAPAFDKLKMNIKKLSELLEKQ